MTATDVPVRYRYRAFGAFRLFLAVLVVVSHMEAVFAPPAVDELLRPLAIGNIGVVCFFVLSGFVITEALAVSYRGRLWAFAVNRMLRIYPPYLLALVVSIGVHLILVRQGLPIMGQKWPSLYDAWQQNVLAVFDYKVPAGLEKYYVYVRYVWAVVIEVQFYAVVAALFALGDRFVRRDRTARALFAAVVLVFAALYVVTIYVKMPAALKLLTFAPYFLTGVCLYAVVAARQAAGATASLFCLAALASMLSVLCFSRYGPFSWVSTGAYVIFLAVFMWLATHELSLSPASRRLDAFLGDLTYPLYLNHFAVEVLIGGYVAARSMTLFWAATAFSLALAFVLQLLLEPALKSLRDRVRGRPLREPIARRAVEILA